MIPIVNFNGDLIQKSSSTFSFDHAAIFNGEVIQEDIRIWDGAMMYQEKHYFHLMAMMRMARIDIPMSFTPEFFYAEINKLKEEQSLENAKISFNVSPNHSSVDFWITAKVLPSKLTFELPYKIDQYRETHVSNGFHDRVNFLKPSNRILDIYAFENELQDLVLLDESKNVARSIHGNIFMIKDETLFVPKLENGALDVVFRKMTIEAAKRVPDFKEIKEDAIFPFALMKADEVFIVKNGEGFFPVTNFRKKNYESRLLPSIVDYFEERG
ncbi:hypothetical protein GO491_07465 [Flavobacteriaceae bacterium Ap0902]|nr:hypothetical protein [Flavobacteriaceae bacterium Ap0902]